MADPQAESGNMLIMALSYTQKTGDNSLIQSYVRWMIFLLSSCIWPSHKQTKLLDQWTQFLIQDSLIPQNQISTDDFAGALANQTNLAIKGITGIKAMSVIQGLLGNTAKSSNYSTIASNYATQFLKLGGQSTTGSHLTLAVSQFVIYLLRGVLTLAYSTGAKARGAWLTTSGRTSTWSWTCFRRPSTPSRRRGTRPLSVRARVFQSGWSPLIYTFTEAYGLPLDTRHSTTWTKSDWQIFTASTVTDTTVRNHLVDLVVKYVSNGLNNVPLSDWYDASSGKTLGFQARPVVGGHLALLTVWGLDAISYMFVKYASSDPSNIISFPWFISISSETTVDPSYNRLSLLFFDFSRWRRQGWIASKERMLKCIRSCQSIRRRVREKAIYQIKYMVSHRSRGQAGQQSPQRNPSCVFELQSTCIWQLMEALCSRSVC
jgi:hypothetical protein